VKAQLLLTDSARRAAEYRMEIIVFSVVERGTKRAGSGLFAFCETATGMFFRVKQGIRWNVCE
jgi:hypothetical protein